jgi:hypothetical protein
MHMSRIPALRSTSRKGVSNWFEAMGAARLLFHPDDDPASIIHVDSGKKFFSATEVRELRGVVRNMFRAQGERVYELGLPAFHRALGITVEE